MKKKNRNWSYLSHFFRYLIRFEPEQEVTVVFFIDCSIISYSQVSFFPASSLNVYMLGEPGSRFTMVCSRPSAGIDLVKHSGITAT